MPNDHGAGRFEQRLRDELKRTAQQCQATPRKPEQVDGFEQRLKRLIGRDDSGRMSADSTDSEPGQEPRAGEQPFEMETGETESVGAELASASMTRETGSGEPVGNGEYVVRQGDCVSSIAKDTGHFWETIWTDAANTELREIRRDPNVLLPGDRVHVPALRRKQETGQTEMRHRFVRKGEPARLLIQIRDRWGNPYDNRLYRLCVGAIEIVNRTDSQGQLQCPITASAGTATLTVWLGSSQPHTWTLKLGALDPAESQSGIQGRLHNLGLHPSYAGDSDERTTEAIGLFQARHSLPVTGQADRATQARLKREHRDT